MRVFRIRLRGARIGELSALVAVVCGVASLIAYWFWVIMLRPSPIPSAFAEGRPDKLASEIQSRHFFGVMGGGGNPRSAISETARLVLAGIVSSSNARHALAIIQVEGKEAVTARVGQEILPNVVLSRVAGDHVELTQNGKIINLRFATKK